MSSSGYSEDSHQSGSRVSRLCIALGAPPNNIVGLVVRHGMGLAAIGIGAGLIGAIALTRVLASLLFGVTPTDAITFIAVAAILGTAAFATTVIPALRASSVDPMVTLREE